VVCLEALMLRVIIELQQGIFLNHALNLLIHLQSRELQQPYRLLQLRCEGQVLR
jgi:hypothetical protein